MRDAGIDVGIAPDDASMLPAYDFVIPDDEVIAVGDLRLRTIHNPGHTPGSTSFLLEGHPILFSGDTLFPGGAGNTKLPGRRLRADHRVDRPPPLHPPRRPAGAPRATASTPRSAERPMSDPADICRSGSTGCLGERDLDDAAGERRLLVRQRQEVQALPQGDVAARRARSGPSASVPDDIARPDYAADRRAGAHHRIGGEVARRDRAHARARAASHATCSRETGAAVARRRHHRRARPGRARGAPRPRRVPEPAALPGLPEVGVHVGQRGDLPRHPRRPRARRRRHRQRRRHRLRRRRARRHQRHVLRRARSTPNLETAGEGHRGVPRARASRR